MVGRDVREWFVRSRAPAVFRTRRAIMPTKTAQLQVRVSPRQKARLRRLAAAAGTDVSAFVLARVLPDDPGRFAALVRGLPEAEAPAFPLAELHDLLTACAAVEFAALVAEPPPATVAPWLANYVAAMVETAAHRLTCPPPPWVHDIVPLDRPWFATDLRALRPYLLRVSPVAFRRRNLFVDTTLGGRA